MNIQGRYLKLVVLLICLLISCRNNPYDSKENSVLRSPTQAFLKGERPAPISAKYIHPDSIKSPKVVPLKGKLKVVQAHPNKHPVSSPISVQKPKDLKVITFGENGVPPPKKITANGKVVSAKQPEPIPAGNFMIKDDALYDIQFLSEEQGLPSSSINVIIEDSRGQMWFGAGNTVIRYTGENFYRYTPNEGLLEFRSGVKSIIEDSKGNIWFGGWGGICYYDGYNFIHFPNEEEYGVGNLKRAGAIIEDSKGNIWFYSTDLYKFDGMYFTIYEKNRAHVHDTEEINTWYTNNDIREIMEDSRGYLWLATLGSGIMRFDGKHLIQLTEEDGLIHNSINNILEDSDGNIWFGSGGEGIRGRGVSRYTPHLTNPDNMSGTLTNFTRENGLSGNRIQDILQDEGGNIWFSTYDGGICRFDGKIFTHFTKNEGLSTNSVNGMMKDRQGNIWFGTNGEGVGRFRQNSFKHFTENQGVGNYGISVIIEDSHGHIWMGQAYDGILKYDGEYFTNYTIENGLLRDHVTNLIEDKHGNLWIIYRDRNMSMFDGKMFTHYTKAQGLSNNPLMDIHEDKEGMIWVAVGWDRVIRFNPESNQITHFLSNLNELIGGGLIFEDQLKNLWFGGHGYLTKYDQKNDQLRFICQVDTIEFGWVDMMIEDKKGNTWLGIPDQTLAQVVKGGEELKTEFPRIFRGRELPDIEFNSATMDQNGNLWVGSKESGLTVFVNGMDNIGQRDFRGIQIAKEDGLKSKNFQFKSVVIDSKNRLWLGNGPYVTMLDLNSYRLPNTPPTNLDLSYIEIQQKYIDYNRLADNEYANTIDFGIPLSQSFDSTVAFKNYPVHPTIPHDLNHLTFHFSADDWVAPHQIRYSYKMEGIDQNWSQPKTEAKADYRNLPYGTFTFQVKAFGIAKIWSEPFTYTFTIRPPWWHTWWAYTIMVLTFASVLYSLFKFQLKRKLELQEANRLKELDTLKNRFYSNITHEFRTPLTVINGMADELDHRSDQDLKTKINLIKKNSSQLLDLINQMLDLSKIQSGNIDLDLHQADIISFIKYLVAAHKSFSESHNIDLAFYSIEEKLMMDFDLKKVEQVVTNLISNAIKFTPEGGTVLVIASKINTAHQPQIEVLVKDNGIGISEEQLPYIFDRFFQVSTNHKNQGTGIGLALVKELLDIMRGSISVESEINRGTTFSLYLPIQNRAPIVSNLELPHFKSIDIPENLETQKSIVINKELPILLIIEDNEDVIYYLKNCLREKYQIITSMNGNQGVQKAFELIPDIIISDVMMPGMDGYQVCATLKEDERTNHIPIILLTARSTSQDKLSGLTQGADAYLIKPFDKVELLIRINKLLEIRKILQNKYSSALISSQSNTSNPENRTNSYIEKVEKIILSNVEDENFSIHTLAKELHLSRSQMYRKIKALTGMSPAIYIRHIRLQKAKELLLSSHLGISEIAYRVGFKTPVYFSQVFKETFGVSPSESRK